MKLIIKYQEDPNNGAPTSFDLDAQSPIRIGRDPDSNDIVFDKTVVSRNHLEIYVDPAAPEYVMVKDLESTNKTYVLRNGNAATVKGQLRLEPGDTLRLGNPGPMLEIDTDPRPLVKTSVQKAPQVSTSHQAAPPPTGAQIPAPQPEKPVHTPPPATGTSYQPRKATPSWLPIGGVLAGAVVLSFGLYSFISSRANANPPVDPGPGPTVEKKLTPEEIMAANRGSVVQIRLSWRLLDADSGAEQFIMKDYQGRPVLIRERNGTITPYLTTIRSQGFNVGGAIYATGFVVSSDGFIMTCAHVVQPERYIPLSQLGTSRAYVYDSDDRRFREESLDLNNVVWDARSYLRSGDQVLVRELKKLGLYDPKKPVVLKGDHAYLEVCFPDETTPFEARMVKADQQQDTALIKIDSPKTLQAADLYDATESIKEGQDVHYIGYPAIGGNVVRRRSNGILDGVPRPSMDRSVVNRVGKGVTGTTKDRVEFEAGFNQVGRGASGGPVFDDYGRVIGILSSGAFILNDSSRKYVVPIRFGKRLLDSN